MRCYICDSNLGGEPGWKVCDECREKYHETADLVEQGKLVALRNEGIITFVAVDPMRAARRNEPLS